MNKEELKELNNAINHCDNVIKELKKIGNCEGCIKDHQQLKKWLINYKKIINQSAYKFEDLKVGMWVYDIQKDFIYKVYETRQDKTISFLLSDGFGYIETFVTYFEENRFYQITKAIKKEDEYNG